MPGRNRTYASYDGKTRNDSEPRPEKFFHLQTGSRWWKWIKEELEMIKIKQSKFPHLVSLVMVLFLVNLAVDAAAYKTKSNKQNRVRVDVRPVQLLPGKPA